MRSTPSTVPVLLFLLLTAPALTMRNMTIFGNATLGYYYLEAFVGTPSQKQTLILDTGSNMTIFPCKGCKKCRNHLNKNFDPTSSDTFRPIHKNTDFLGWKCKFFNEAKNECAFHQGYTEGSAYIGNRYALKDFCYFRAVLILGSGVLGGKRIQLSGFELWVRDIRLGVR